MINSFFKFYYKLTKQELIVTEIFSGILTKKEREKTPPKSYSLHMPQALLNSAYREDPNRYDHFYVYINNKRIHVAKEIYDKLELNKKYEIKRTGPNMDLELSVILENLKETFEIKEI